MEIGNDDGAHGYKPEPASPPPMIPANSTPPEGSSTSFLIRKHGDRGQTKAQKNTQLHPPRPRVCRREGGKKKKTANLTPKGHYWTPAEDGVLMSLVTIYGLKQWTTISRAFSSRTGKQCRERWHNHLRPDIKVTWWLPDVINGVLAVEETTMMNPEARVRSMEVAFRIKTLTSKSNFERRFGQSFEKPLSSEL